MSDIAVLGTGMVGLAHAARLAELGHHVTLGSRAAVSGQPPEGDLGRWCAEHDGVVIADPATAAGNAELVVNALNGQVAVQALAALSERLAGKVVLDISNPLDFSTGQLELFVCNTDSLGEQIQRVLPYTRVVKALCTVTADVQVDAAVIGGESDMFIAGDDADAKAAVAELIRGYGWERIIDLGDITAARALEMMLPLWVRLYQALGSGLFNYRLIGPPAR